MLSSGNLHFKEGKEMKKISKKLLSFLLAFGMILSMFAVNSATIQAADEHVPASATLVAYPKPAIESLAS